MSRQIEPAKLGRFVKGELDWIVLKALSKDRNRRYETANGFARDFERFLAHEPVQAGPPSASYRFKKFVQRNRGQVIAASLVLLALVAGVIGTTLGLIEAKRQTEIARSEAEAKELARAEEATQRGIAETNEKLAGERLVQVEAEKKRADEEKQIAQAVKEFLQNKLLAQAATRFQVDALLKAGGNLAEAKPNPSVRELLDRAAKELAPDKIEANFPKQPLVQAEILRTVGVAYNDIGEPGTAINFSKRAEALHRQHLGPDDPATLESMNILANVYRSAGQWNTALPLLEETHKLTKAKLGPDHPSILGCMNNLAICYSKLKRLDKSVPLFEELLPLQEKKLGRDHQDTQRTVANVGVNYKDAGRLKEAIPLLEEAYRASKKFPNVRFAGPQLFEAYAQAGQRGKAAKLIDELLPNARKTSPKDSPELAGMMDHFGMSLLKMKGYAEAEPLLRECLAIREEKEPNDWRTFNTLSMLGQALLGQKKYPDAEPLLLQGYEGMKARQETIPPPAAAVRIPEALDRLIELYTATNKPDEAQKYRELRAEYPPELAP